ncbi:MAG: class I SAM-dependent methyltransferase [Thermoleophilia bacterium]
MREHRVFAALYDLLGRRAERGPLGARRRELLREASGRVLELGAGTGANLPHYPALAELTLTEPDAAMRRRLAPRAAGAPFPVELLDAPAEDLPVADATIDIVVSTLVLCSVDDPPRALAEARRVLRPGGRLLFLEHVRAEGRAARWQDRLDPASRRLCAGCHPNRDTVAAIRRAGFAVTALRRLPDVPAAPWARPVVAGVAVAPAEG